MSCLSNFSLELEKPIVIFEINTLGFVLFQTMVQK